jgi:hypothetical protein
MSVPGFAPGLTHAETVTGSRLQLVAGANSNREESPSKALVAEEKPKRLVEKPRAVGETEN